MKTIRSMPVPLLMSRALLVLAATVLTSRGGLSADGQKRIGIVFPTSASASAFAEEALWERMRELGWIDGKNLVIVKRFGNARPELLSVLTREVLTAQVDVLITAGARGALAAKKASTTTPIVSVPCH